MLGDRAKSVVLVHVILPITWQVGVIICPLQVKAERC